MPFFATLQKWLFSGELYDPYNEFFVAIDPTLAHIQHVHPSALSGGNLARDGGLGLTVDGDYAIGNKDSGLRLWETKYDFRAGMLPTFVGEDFGRKVCMSPFVRNEWH
jgi:gamma-tubulin complex component 3